MPIKKVLVSIGFMEEFKKIILINERVRVVALVDKYMPSERALEFGYVPNEDKIKLIKLIKEEKDEQNND